MSPEERARRVVYNFRQGEDKSTQALLELVTEAIRKAILEERHACLKCMYTGIDLEKIERVIRSRT